MILTGDAVFLEARSFTPEGRDKLTFATFGFQQDFDRREVAVSNEMISSLPVASNSKVKITFQITKRYDGKEDIRLLECKAAG